MKKSQIVLAICALASANGAWAFSNHFLKDAPIAHFNREDVSLLMQAANAALNEAADGEVREWRNPKTGSAGTVKPLKTTDDQKGTCRTVAFSTSYQHLAASSQTVLCKQANGQWKAPAPNKKSQ